MKFVLPIVALAVAGCATAPSPEMQAKAREIDATIPTCKSEQECKVKWGAARSWVLANAGYRIQTYSDDFLETYPASGGSTRLAVRINKEPDGKGGWRFIGSVWCDNLFACDRVPADALLDLQRHVTGSWSQ